MRRVFSRAAAKTAAGVTPFTWQEDHCAQALEPILEHDLPSG